MAQHKSMKFRHSKNKDDNLKRTFVSEKAKYEILPPYKKRKKNKVATCHVLLHRNHQCKTSTGLNKQISIKHPHMIHSIQSIQLHIIIHSIQSICSRI